MNFRKIVAFFFFFFETSIYLVRGKTSKEDKSDCTKLLNYLKGNSKEYENNCCTNDGDIRCNDNGNIIYFRR